MEVNKHYIKLATTILIIVLLVVFIVQNLAVVELNFLFWSVAMRRSLIILSVFSIGILIGWLARGILEHREKNRTRQTDASSKHE